MGEQAPGGESWAKKNSGLMIHSQSPESIATTYPSLTREQVYATITYYLHNKKAIDAYLTEWLEHGRLMREKQARNPTPVMLRLRELKAKRQKQSVGATHEYNQVFTR